MTQIQMSQRRKKRETKPFYDSSYLPDSLEWNEQTDTHVRELAWSEKSERKLGAIATLYPISIIRTFWLDSFESTDGSSVRLHLSTDQIENEECLHFN